MDEIERIRNNYSNQRQHQIDEHQNRTWADWLRYKAENGDRDALIALRFENRKSKSKYSLSGGRADNSPADINIIDSITKEGTEIYKIDKAVIRNNGHEIKISKAGSIDSLKKALEMARRQYGNCIRVNGSPLFKKIILHILIHHNLPITFADTDMEAQRTKLKQEINNEYTRRNQYDNGRRTAGNDEATGTGDRLKWRKTRTKPNPHGTKRGTPAENQNSLRDLSQLDVVQLARGSEVLLSDHAHDQLERQRLKPDNHVRRNIFRVRRKLS